MINKEKALELVQMTESRLADLKASIAKNNTDSMETRIAANTAVVPLNLLIELIDE